MTNKIKPFCVNVQDIDGKGTVATEQQIRDLHKMCINIGAVEDESVEIFLKDTYTYNYKGVSKYGDTYSSDGLALFEHNLFTLQEVEAYLTPTLEDTTLVEGTLEHAYVTLKGDLSNCENAYANVDFNTVWVDISNSKFYLSSTPTILPSVNTAENVKGICTVEEFQTYCEEQRLNSSVNSTLSDDTSPEDESPIESVKPLKWTVCAQEQGIPLQVGMLCVDEEGIELEVKYLGERLAIVNEVEDELECSAPVSALLPFPKELTPVEEQREKVLEYLNGCTTKFRALDIYDDLSKLGVFKL